MVRALASHAPAAVSRVRFPRYMWVESVVSFLCSDSFSFGYNYFEFRPFPEKKKHKHFQILCFSVRSPPSHANSETDTIFVYIASATWREDDNPQRGQVSGKVGVLSPGCARNINKDGVHFEVRVRSRRSYGKIEDSKQSTNLVTFDLESSLV